MTGQSPQVAILLGTYNGAAFLAEQLDSLAAQSYPHWRLWVSDDGSTDDTLKILKDYQAKWGPDKLTFGPGPGQGFVQNFLSLTDNPEIAADYYAWCDQDDIWLPGKLSRAISQLAPGGQEKPALYGGRTILVDRNNKEYGLSPLLNRRPPSFAHSLVQCIGGGNTMVFNRPARELVRVGSGLAPVSHDWWAYQVVSGVGGQVIYDEEPQIRYRQHGRNLYGSNQGWSARLARLRRVVDGTFRQRNGRNLAALSVVADRLTAASRRELEAFSNLRRADRPWQRWRQLKDSGIFRQGRGQQLALKLAALMKQV
ncbi:MAG: glycosyltransferase family 2 protein [Candidatus Adiutrix sp.]|jgi:glycosyltransferase involved in cell wall biosynthesis|nr:glycosyltransferase family 2 protein [Candidatus Adiutrix sp.]